MTHSLPEAPENWVQPSEPTFQAAETPTEEFLRLRIDPNASVLFPLQQLTEVLSIPENQIMPIPHMPAWMMGIYNWRGEILWVADLGYLCGFTPWYQSPTHRSTYSAVVLHLIDDASQSTSSQATAKSQFLGLVVQQIEEMEECRSNEIHLLSPVSIPPRLTELAASYWQKPDGNVLPVLDGKRLLNTIACHPRL